MYNSREEEASLPVAIESVMLSCVIDAMKGRDVATVDIPGASMQADINIDSNECWKIMKIRARDMTEPMTRHKTQKS